SERVALRTGVPQARTTSSEAAPSQAWRGSGAGARDAHPAAASAAAMQRPRIRTSTTRGIRARGVRSRHRLGRGSVSRQGDELAVVALGQLHAAGAPVGLGALDALAARRD